MATRRRAGVREGVGLPGGLWAQRPPRPPRRSTCSPPRSAQAQPVRIFMEVLLCLCSYLRRGGPTTIY